MRKNKGSGGCFVSLFAYFLLFGLIGLVIDYIASNWKTIGLVACSVALIFLVVLILKYIIVKRKQQAQKRIQEEKRRLQEEEIKRIQQEEEKAEEEREKSREVLKYIDDVQKQLKIIMSSDKLSKFFDAWNLTELYLAKINEIQGGIPVGVEETKEVNIAFEGVKDSKQILIQSCLRKSFEGILEYITQGYYELVEGKKRHDYLKNITISTPEEAVDFWEQDILSFSQFYDKQTKNLAESLIEKVEENLQTIIDAENDIQYVDSMEGHDFEKWCARLLMRTGYTDVEVTKGSGDQGVDIIAVKESVRYAIQCKCYTSKLGNTSIQEVYSGRKMYDCHVGVVMTNNYFTSGAIELAQKTGVLLWDRDKIKQMLEQAQ